MNKPLIHPTRIVSMRTQTEFIEEVEKKDNRDLLGLFEVIAGKRHWLLHEGLYDQLAELDDDLNIVRNELLERFKFMNN